MRNTPRTRYFFYRKKHQVDSAGETEILYETITSGYFAREVVRKPIEISSASVNQHEIQYVLRGAWVKTYATEIDEHSIAFDPASDKVYEVVASPVDNLDKRREILIYVVDNIQRDIDTRFLDLNV